MEGKLLQKYYKENLSEYYSWAQQSHALDYILFPKNISYHLSIDETALSCGKLYTILSNKAAKGRKGSIVAIVKGTKAECVIKVLNKIPLDIRKMVKEVTLDMAPTMQKIVSSSFPKAIQVINRFHVQKLAYEALQEVRISHRWEQIAIEEEQIKLCKTTGTEYKISYLENGDTLRQLLARSRYLLFKTPDKWSQAQKVRAKLLFKYFPDLEHLYHKVLQLRQVYSQTELKDVARLKLAKWYNQLEGIGNQYLSTLAKSIENNYDRILNFFVNRSTNASAESLNAKLKAFRATFRGVKDIRFFLFRVAKIYA